MVVVRKDVDFVLKVDLVVLYVLLGNFLKIIDRGKGR